MLDSRKSSRRTGDLALLLAADHQAAGFQGSRTSKSSVWSSFFISADSAERLNRPSLRVLSFLVCSFSYPQPFELKLPGFLLDLDLALGILINTTLALPPPLSSSPWPTSISKHLDPSLLNYLKHQYDHVLELEEEGLDVGIPSQGLNFYQAVKLFQLLPSRVAPDTIRREREKIFGSRLDPLASFSRCASRKKGHGECTVVKEMMTCGKVSLLPSNVSSACDASRISR